MEYSENQTLESFLKDIVLEGGMVEYFVDRKEDVLEYAVISTENNRQIVSVDTNEEIVLTNV